MTMSSDELWKARFAVKRAVLDCVAHDYHDEATASSVHHGDYLEDMLDEALKEYAEAYLKDQIRRDMEGVRDALEASQGFAEPTLIVSPGMKSEVVEFLENGLNRRAD